MQWPWAERCFLPLSRLWVERERVLAEADATFWCNSRLLARTARTAFDKATNGKSSIFMGETLISWRVATRKGSTIAKSKRTPGTWGQPPSKRWTLRMRKSTSQLIASMPILLFVDNTTVANIRSGALTKLIDTMAVASASWPTWRKTRLNRTVLLGAVRAWTGV